ncbi:MAG TPA: GNAT family N-acetyltransferase [bacterium]|nr:GNAT family N-acetyltransferase [bacterium]
MIFRTTVRPDDPQRIRDIVTSTGFFYDHEITVAVELCEENLAKGEEKSGYFFVFADDEATGRTLGYACYGEIACTRKRYDLYWMGVHADARGKGIGKQLMKETDRAIAARGGEIVYIETSSREKYLPTREFYIATGCVKEAELKDFYDNGDHKVIYTRRLR